MSVLEILPRLSLIKEMFPLQSAAAEVDSGSESESEPEDLPCGDLRCPKCLDRGSMITEKAPLKWSAKLFKSKKNGRNQLSYNLSEDLHLIHLMDIPAKKYLVYQVKQLRWVNARIGQPERISPKSSIVVYRAEGTDPFFCDGMGNILGMIHVQIEGQVPEETARKSEDQASSLLEEEHRDIGIKLVPSSQESMDGISIL